MTMPVVSQSEGAELRPCITQAYIGGRASYKDFIDTRIDGDP
jgi:hypothetical protein